MPSTFLLRYGEIALKGQNRGFFLETLARNVARAVEDLGPSEVRAAFGRILVSVEADPEAAADRLRKVFGVVSLSRVRDVSLDLGTVTSEAVALAEEAVTRQPEIVTFKVDTRR
ncbi:MAG TPA: tRNA 4-thiouridine(8) synthase ThiI, partial [bacterium]|nr:tRNA 4-thiouridine(8) synthase ThiI [bacterium]